MEKIVIKVGNTISVDSGVAMSVVDKYTTVWFDTDAKNGLYSKKLFSTGIPEDSEVTDFKLKYETVNPVVWPSCQSILDISTFISTDQTRYFLNGVYFDTENSAIVATNGRVMIFKEMDLPFKKSFILPMSKPLEYLLKQENTLFMEAYDKYLLVEADGIVLKIEFIDGMFPNWKRVMPLADDNNKYSIELPSLEFMKIAKKINREKKLGVFVTYDTVNESWNVVENDENIYSEMRNHTLDENSRAKFNLEYLTGMVTLGHKTLMLNTDRISERAAISYIGEKSNIVIMPITV